MSPNNSESNEDTTDPSFTTGYRFIDHTADIGVHSRGRTLEESFGYLSMGMMDVLSTDLKRVEWQLEQRFSVEAGSLEDLVVSYLSELLFLFDTEQLLFSDFRVTITKAGETYHLKAALKGERFDSEKHPYPVEIKAVTEHMLQVKDEPPFDITVIFDL